jgi:Flp pilus assembly CpaE family ATPase
MGKRMVDRLGEEPASVPPRSELVGDPAFERTSRSRARAMLGIKDLALQEEVLDYLDRDPRIEVVGTASQADRLARLIADLSPQATVVCPDFSRDLRHPAATRRAGAILIVTEEMSVPVLREAIDAGARGVFGWPEERAELAQAIAKVPSEEPVGGAGRARVIAVYGARGGAGVTFIATQLAAALADRGRRCALVDLDTGFAGLTVALGVRSDESVRTVADLAPVVEELSPQHLEDALYQHPRGFSVLLGPGEDLHAAPITSGLYQGSIGLMAGSFDVIVLHLPRILDDLARTGAVMADEVLLVATLDLFSLYGARRALLSLRLDEPRGRCRLVLNRVSRGPVTPLDAQRVLGLTNWVGVRFDAAVARAQDKGELLSSGARRAGADVRSLAKLIDSQPEADRPVGQD